MDAIKEIINSVITRLSEKRKRDLKQEAQSALKKFLDKEETKHVKVATFFHGVLCISVDSPTRAYQLNFKKEKMLRYLDESLGSGTLKDIYFRIGKIK